MGIVKRIAKAFGVSPAVVRHDIEESIDLAMQDPELRKLFKKRPTPDQFVRSLSESHK